MDFSPDAEARGSEGLGPERSSRDVDFSRDAEARVGPRDSDPLQMVGFEPACRYRSGAITRLTMAITLMRIFIDGPDVSLKGSPTVSPTTAAA